MFTADFSWFLAQSLTSAISAFFLLNDLTKGRTYVIPGDRNSIDEKIVIISRGASPGLFFMLLGCIALCTAYMLVTGSLQLAAALTSIDITGWSRLSPFVYIPHALVIAYVLQSISVRLFARWWDY